MKSLTWNEEELLFDKLETAVYEYCETYGTDDEKRQNLFHVLRNNDCREMIATHIDWSNVFTCAANRNHLDILEAFLDQGMKMNIQDQYGDFALMYASMNGHEDSVRLLLNRNATSIFKEGIT